MGNKEKIIWLLEHELVSGYAIEVMSDGRLHSTNFYRYRKCIRDEKKALFIFDSMSNKMEQLLLELAEEVTRVQPKSKKEVKQMAFRYSHRLNRTVDC